MYCLNRRARGSRLVTLSPKELQNRYGDLAAESKPHGGTPLRTNTAPFAVLLVVDVLVEMVGAVLAAVAARHAIAVSAFRAHGVTNLVDNVEG